MKATLSLLAAALALAACQTSSARKEEPAAPAVRAAPAHDWVGKPQAPVAIEAEAGAGAALVRVRFDQAGTDVEVLARGGEGLVLLGDAVLARGRSVTAGEVATFEVPYAPGPGQSRLSVQVSGAFAAGRRGAVRAFPVGKKSPAQLEKAREGTTQLGGEGVHLVPAEETRK